MTKNNNLNTMPTDEEIAETERADEERGFHLCEGCVEAMLASLQNTIGVAVAANKVAQKLDGTPDTAADRTIHTTMVAALITLVDLGAAYLDDLSGEGEDLYAEARNMADKMLVRREAADKAAEAAAEAEREEGIRKPVVLPGILGGMN